MSSRNVTGGAEDGSKKEAVQMAKREKRMKLQKAMECFRKVGVGHVKPHAWWMLTELRPQAQKIIRSANATRKDLEEGIEYLNAAVSMRPTNGRYYFARWVAVLLLMTSVRRVCD